jgi:hypothetical protein
VEKGEEEKGEGKGEVKGEGKEERGEIRRKEKDKSERIYDIDMKGDLREENVVWKEEKKEKE